MGTASCGKNRHSPDPLSARLTSGSARVAFTRKAAGVRPSVRYGAVAACRDPATFPPKRTAILCQTAAIGQERSATVEETTHVGLRTFEFMTSAMKFFFSKTLQFVMPLVAVLIGQNASSAPTSHELPTKVHQQIVTLSTQGDNLASARNYAAAIDSYRRALKLVPRPISDWEAATWLLVAIGDAYFLAGDFAQARTALTEAMQCPGAIGNPFIHLRLGQTHYELGNMEKAGDELARAYLQEGTTIFKADNPKYLAFIKARLKPPPGGWPQGW